MTENEIMEHLAVIYSSLNTLNRAVKMLLDESINEAEKELEEGKGVFNDLDEVVDNYFDSLEVMK